MGTVDWIDELGRLTPTAWSGAKAGWSEESFSAVFHQNYSRIVGVAARVLGERAQAEEVADDAFWRLYRRPQLQQDGNNIAAWLYRTASRLAIDVLRGRKRLRLAQEVLAAEPANPAPRGPLAEMLADERVLKVRQSLAALKPQQAQILALRHSGLSYAEVATALGIKPSSVGTTLARAEAAFEAQYRRSQ
jgi:RNA polymerase sigma-70 factor (ECF subfamily)